MASQPAPSGRNSGGLRAAVLVIGVGYSTSAHQLVCKRPPACVAPFIAMAHNLPCFPHPVCTHPTALPPLTLWCPAAVTTV